MKTSVILANCLIAATVVALPAQASDWLVTGFATVGASYINNDKVFFSLPAQRRTERPKVDFGANTFLGLQIEHAFADKSSAVLQLRFHDHSDNRYKPQISRAFIRHELSPNITLRAGRLHMPSFMWSESLELNYGQPWIRPPVEVYGINPLADVDGVDLIIRARVSDYDIELVPYAGAGGLHKFPNGRARYSSHRGLTVSFEKDGFLLHLGHSLGKVSILPTDQLHELAQAELGAGVLSGRQAKASFSSIGFRYETDRFQLMGELASRSAERYVNSAYGWHLTAAYRHGSITPFLTIARQQQTRSVIPSGTAMTPLLQRYELTRNPSQKSLTVGVRWDAGRNHAFKAQLSRIKIPDNAWGSFLPRDQNAGYSPAGKTLDMLSLSVDFVF